MCGIGWVAFTERLLDTGIGATVASETSKALNYLEMRIRKENHMENEMELRSILGVYMRQ